MADADDSKSEMDPKIEDALNNPPHFDNDMDVFSYYQDLGQQLGKSGAGLQRFIDLRVSEYEEKWKSFRIAQNKQSEIKANASLVEKQIKLKELRKAELEMEQSLKVVEEESLEKKRLHEIHMKNLEIEEDRKKREEADKAKQLELDQIRQLKMMELEEKRHERELAEAKLRLEENRLKHEREQREHELELQRMKDLAQERQIEQKREHDQKKHLPKMNNFKEERDDIGSFLYRYEVMCKEHGWKPEKWGVYLGNYLDGSALSLFHQLSVDESNTYETIKEELLFKFQCDAEGFHEKFRNCKPKTDESYRAFYTRISQLFDRWLDMTGIDKTYEALYDFMVAEQMLAGSCKELQVYLKEKELVTTKDIISSANAYRSAHQGKDLARKGIITLANSNSQSAAAADQFTPSANRNQRGGRQGFGQRGGSNHRGGSRGGYSNQSQRTSSQDHKQASQDRNFKQDTNRKKCTFCGRNNHIKEDCNYFKKHNASAAVTPLLGSACAANVPTARGKVNGQPAIIMRDTGASVAGVRRSFVPEDQILQETITVQMFDGAVKEFPTAKVEVRSPFFTGNVIACVIDAPPYDLVLGNVDGTKQGDLILASTAVQQGCVSTRANAKKEAKITKPLSIPATPELGVSKEELVELQKQDLSLEEFRKKVGTKSENNVSYIFENDLLCRVFEDQNKDTSIQILVPVKLRKPLLQMAHECLLAGHGGRKRTTERLFSNFFWPKMQRDVKEYCRSCDRCQKTSPKIPNIPLDFMPVITEPFSRISIDITGPFSPPSNDGHSYILSIIDVATRFPEAVALKKIDTATVAEEVIKVCARMGFPKEILSDNASQFTSDMMKEICRLMAIKQVHSSPYHAQSNGIVERFHGTIKPMLRKLTVLHPRDWHRYLPALLYACRDVPNASTGFAPFELLFGRRPRGPLDLIAEKWKGSADQAQQSTFQYVCELQSFFEEAAKMVKMNVEQAARANKKYADRGSKPRKFNIDDEVLLFLPDNQNKLLMGWKGPFRVKKCRQNDYIIEIDGKNRLFHANMLKKYYRRDASTSIISNILSDDKKLIDKPVDNSEIIGNGYNPMESISCIASVFIPDDEDEDMSVNTLPPRIEETLDDAKLDDKLSDSMKKEMRKALESTEDLYKMDPGLFKQSLEHEIPVTSVHPVRKKQYPLPFSSKETLRAEVDYMEKIGVIERSSSPYCSPIVLIKKKDSSTRVCMDFRDLNKITIFDAEPIPDVEELFIKLAGKRFFTKVDLCKGYWQIAVKPEDRPKTAFQAPQGLFQFTRMPFGLVTAPATFARMMRQLDLESCSSMNFFDDILTASETWQEHLKDVQRMLKKLQENGLTVRPSKIYAGFRELEFLGHVVGDGKIRPEKSKVEKILSVSQPTSKKQVRSIMGLLGYYRRYIPGYSVITAPITDQLKGTKKSITWTPECEAALKTVQTALSNQPILILPDLNKKYTVQTDASNSGIAGVLLQEQGDKLHPVAYVSRKLLDRETRYSTIEKECLAIVWTLKKLDRYLWGQRFLLQTDHKPLTFLNSAMFKNNRILGWSLALQGYSFEVKEIAGRDNILADMLSRSGADQVIP